jgi:hypothetical protein
VPFSPWLAGYPRTMDDREQQRMREALEEKQEEARAKAEENQLDSPDRPQEEKSVRAKSSGHHKKTADKWNQ